MTPCTKQLYAFHAATAELLKRRGQLPSNADKYEQFFNYVVRVDQATGDFGLPLDPLECVTRAILAKHKKLMDAPRVR